MCPNLHILKSFKIHPRIIHFDYIENRYFVYVYLNPFSDVKESISYTINNKNYCFGYSPLYIGKGTGAGYRHNQHISSFLKKTEKNHYKTEWFNYLEKQMIVAKLKKDYSKPWNWDEYKKSYVVVLEVFKTAEDLLDFEVKMIQTIGTLKRKTGPLVNIISN